MWEEEVANSLTTYLYGLFREYYEELVTSKLNPSILNKNSNWSHLFYSIIRQ